MASNPPAQNPFTPGSGRMPPYIAGREHEQAVISDFIGELSRSQAPQAIIMVGPRGCGKTVLNNWCREAAPGIDSKIRVKKFKGKLPNEEAHIARELLDQLFDLRRPDEVTTRLGVGGFVGGETKYDLKPTGQMIINALIAECRSSPLLLIVDEAAENSRESLGELFNLHQDVNAETGNLLLVLAGTPNVVQVLRSAGATFMNRNKVLNIGLLDETESAEAITVPLSKKAMSIDEAALKHVIGESHGYPHFLQLWGRALFNKAARQNRQKILLEDVHGVASEVANDKNVIYSDRYAEWSAQDMKILAEVLTRTQDQRQSGQLTRANLAEAVVQRLGEIEGTSSRAEAFTEKILATGCLWQPWGQDRLVSGLPSFVDYVLQNERGLCIANLTS